MNSDIRQWLQDVVANATDACDLITKEYKSLADWQHLLFSPQGIEYCTSKNYPTLEMWRQLPISKGELKEMDIFIDSGFIEIYPKNKVALIGNTQAIVKSNNPTALRSIVLLHGASATIIAQNYAVVRIDKSIDSNIKIVNDSTAIIL